MSRWTIAQIEQHGKAFYRWADRAFYPVGYYGWPPEHPWGQCTHINEVARVLLERHGYRCQIVGLPDDLMPTWWQEKFPTGHDWVLCETGETVDLWPEVYGEPGKALPLLPLNAEITYDFDEIGFAREMAIADLALYYASKRRPPPEILPVLPLPNPQKIP